MSSAKHCCVPGCVETQGMNVLHKFPNPDKERKRFNDWLHAVGGSIVGLENEHIYKYRRLCRRHFEDKYLCRSNKISNIAIPTLNMPVSLKEPTSQNPCSSSSPGTVDAEKLVLNIQNHDDVMTCPSVQSEETQNVENINIKQTPVRPLKQSLFDQLKGNLEVEENNTKCSEPKPTSLRSKKHPALSKPKPKKPFEKVAESKLEIIQLQKTILEEELINNRKKFNFEEEERQHKRELWALEKELMLKKLKE